MKGLFKLALNNIRNNKVRYLLLLLTFTLSIITIIATIKFKKSALEIRENQLRDNTLNSQIIIRLKDEQKVYFKPDTVIQDLKNIEGIKYMVPRLIGLASNENIEGQQLNVIGTDFQEQSKVYSFNLKSHKDISGNSKKIIISEGYSRENNIKLGDKLTLVSNDEKMSFVVYGIAENKGIFQNSDIVVISKSDAENLLNKKGLDTTIGITIKDLSKVDEVMGQIKRCLSKDFVAEQRYDMDSYKAYVGTIDIALNIFSVFSIFITLFLTYSTLEIMLHERMKQMAVLRSIGASKLQVISSIFIENIIIYLISAAAGTLISYPLLKTLIFMIAENRGELAFTFTELFFALGILLLTVLAGLILAVKKFIKISTVSIIKGYILKPGNKISIVKTVISLIFITGAVLLFSVGDDKPSSLYYLISGMALFSAGFILLIPMIHLAINKTLFRVFSFVGPEFKIFIKEFTRDFSKVKQSIILICCVVALGCLSSTIAGSINSTVDKVYKYSDLVLNTYSPNPDLENNLKELEGIGVVVSQERTETKIGDLDVTISGIDPVSYIKVSSEFIQNGSKQETFSKLDSEEKNIIVTKTFAKNMKKNVGDTIELSTDRGMIKYNISAIVGSFEDMGKVLFISKDNFNEDFHSKYNLYLINSKKGYSINDLQKDIRALVGQDAMYSLDTLQGLKQANEEGNSKIFLLADGLFIISLIITVITLNNNLSISIFTKLRELAIKRTLGMSLKQIFITIFGEGFLIGLEGGILGAIFDLVLNLYIVKILSYYIGDLSLTINLKTFIAYIAIAGIIGLISSIYPYLKIKKLDTMLTIKEIM